MTPKLTIPDELRQRFRSFITGRCGLYFKDHDISDLEAVIADRMKSLSIDSVISYYTYLTASEHKEDELRELLNRLTINHTYFFRNEAQFKALEERVLPELIERKRSSVGREHVGRGTSNVQRPTSYGTERPTLRIWSAGCSTGEEPYSIAISLRETIPDIDEWDVQIFATDASEEALSRARRGIYGKNAVKPVSEERLEKYFTESADRDRSTKYEVRSTIKKMVTFNFHNLIEDEFQFGFDIIFCRNVVIYFEMDTTMNCISSDLFGHLGVI